MYFLKRKIFCLLQQKNNIYKFSNRNYVFFRIYQSNQFLYYNKKKNGEKNIQFICKYTVLIQKYNKLQFRSITVLS